MKITLLIRTALLLLLLQIPLLAQTEFGKISGTLSDASGAAIPGASVTARNEKTGETRTVVTNSEGTFLFVTLRPSLYTISASAANFENHEQRNIEILVGQEAKLSLVLQPQGVTANVDIVSDENSAL